MMQQSISDGTVLETFEPGQGVHHMKHDPRDDRFAFCFTVLPRGTYIRVLKLSASKDEVSEVMRIENMDRPLRFLSNGDLVATGTLPEKKCFGALIFSEHGDVVETFDVDYMTNSVAVVDGHALAFLGSNLKLWRPGEEVREFERKTYNSPISISASPDGDYLATVHSEAYLRVWSVDKGKQLKRITTAKYFPLGSCFSPDGTSLLHGAYNKAKPGSPMELVVHDVGKKWPVSATVSLPVYALIEDMGFSADGTRMWILQKRNSESPSVLSIWDWATRTCLHTITYPIDKQRNYIRSATLSADGTRAFVLSSSWSAECTAKLIAFDIP